MKTSILILAATLSFGACQTEDLAATNATGEADVEQLGSYGSAELGVFVMDNVASRNAIVAYRRRSNGALLPGGVFPTGGLGSGGGLGSQSALILSDNGRWLYAVNAGSDEISVFEVYRSVLVLRDIVPSGGVRPISLTVHGGLLYALNAGSEDAPGNISGFVADGGALTPLPESTRALSGDAVGPAQVAFSPSGEVLVVSEKATNNLTTYRVGEDGTPGEPIVTPSNGATPFGFSFNREGTLVVSEAFGGAEGASAVSSYRIGDDGSPELISGSVPTGQTAACWIAISRDGRYAYTTNTGSNNLSGYQIDGHGGLALFNDGGNTAPTGDGPIDVDFTADGRLLYVLNARDDSISVLRAYHNGSLRLLGTISDLPASSVGIAAR